MCTPTCLSGKRIVLPNLPQALCFSLARILSITRIHLSTSLWSLWVGIGWGWETQWAHMPRVPCYCWKPLSHITLWPEQSCHGEGSLQSWWQWLSNRCLYMKLKGPLQISHRGFQNLLDQTGDRAVVSWLFLGESLCSVMLVAQSCPTLCNTMDCSLPGSSAPGILQTGILEWVAIPFSGNLLNQELNLGLLHCRKILYCLSHQGSQGVLSHIGKIHLERLTFHRKVRESYFQSAFHVCMLKWLGMIERAGLISVLGTVPEGDVWASNSLLCSLTFLRGRQDSRREDITQGPWFQATESDTSQEGNLFMNITSQVVVNNVPANAWDIRDRFDPWVWKFPWHRAWQPTPVFLPGESHGQRSLVGHSL